ncbi:MAG: hypothetical protein ABGW99_08510 [Zunongwangia sp.]|jgi:hypothetical protein|uniref:hypothetical protein n=1 Tax=Zunongwangia sp. TaxID=1965325 RepID=UPI003242715B
MPRSVKNYERAFSNAMHLDSKEFQIKRRFKNDKNQSCLVQSDNGVFIISSLEDLYELAETYLTDNDMAMYLDDLAASEAFEEVHYKIEFYDKLFTYIEKEDWPDLNMALNLHKLTEIDFWNAINTYCSPEVFGFTVVTAAKFFNLDILKSDLVEYIIENGEELLNHFQDGFFS